MNVIKIRVLLYTHNRWGLYFLRSYLSSEYSTECQQVQEVSEYIRVQVV